MGQLKVSSNIFYTIENKNEAETFSKKDFEAEIEQERVTVVGEKRIHLNNEDEVYISVPILKGYEPPYDADITQDMETNHYIYYNHSQFSQATMVSFPDFSDEELDKILSKQDVDEVMKALGYVRKDRKDS